MPSGGDGCGRHCPAAETNRIGYGSVAAALTIGRLNCSIMAHISGSSPDVFEAMAAGEGQRDPDYRSKALKQGTERRNESYACESAGGQYER